MLNYVFSISYERCQVGSMRTHVHLVAKPKLSKTLIQKAYATFLLHLYYYYIKKIKTVQLQQP